MNCSECNNTLADAATSCPYCGAPVEAINAQHNLIKVRRVLSRIFENISKLAKFLMSELKPKPTGQDEAHPDQPKLWNPLVIAILEFPLLGLFCASGMVALNWQRLKQPRLARLAWYAGPAIFIVVLLIDYFGRLDMSAFGWGISAFLAWFIILGLPQILHVRNHVVGYQRRRWILPIGVGVAISFIAPFIGATVYALFDKVTLSEPDAMLTPKQVVRQMGRYVYPVIVRWDEDESFLFFWTSTKSNEKQGSAVALKGESGVLDLVTNRHVVSVPSGAKNVARTIDYNGTELPFNVAALGKGDLDMALIIVRSPQISEAFTTPYQLHNKLEVGEGCAAIGNALGGGLSVTSGIISRFDDLGTNVMIRTSAPISPGNSGGGLFSLKGGALVGITSSSFEGNGAQNVNFAIPMDYITQPDLWQVLDQTSR